jgi:hypothetical protein
MNINKNINEKELLELYNIFITYYNSILNFIKKNKIKMRLPIFQESLSENMIRLFILNNEKRNCNCSKVGDLCIDDNIKIEVKCFSSSGPSSFGPTESWNKLYFLDALNFNENKFKIYKCNLSNNSEEWSKLKINSKETYSDVCKKGIRPRLEFNKIKLQLGNKIELLFEGNINKMITNNIEENIQTLDKIKKGELLSRIIPKNNEPRDFSKEKSQATLHNQRSLSYESKKIKGKRVCDDKEIIL